MLIVPFQAQAGGGGVITYVGSAPGQAVYWALVSVDPETGLEGIPLGTLRYEITITDQSSRATNIYLAPAAEPAGGRFDRVKAWHAGEVGETGATGETGEFGESGEPTPALTAALVLSSASFQKSHEETIAITVALTRATLEPVSLRLQIEGGKGRYANGDPLENYGLGANYEVSAGLWLRTVDLESLDGCKYESAYTVVQFEAGEISKTVSLQIVNNPIFELDRALTVTLVSPNGCDIAAGSRTITIIDDNVPAVDGHRNIINIIDPNRDFDSGAAYARGLVGADNTGNTEIKSVVEAAINWLHTNGGGVIYYPNGTYAFGLTATSAMQLWDNITHWGESKDGTIIQVADNFFLDHGSWLFSTNTNFVESGSLTTSDSSPFAFTRMTQDGNPEGNSGAGEQRHINKFYAASSGGGQVVGFWDYVHFRGGGGDAINLAGNAKLYGYNLTHVEAGRCSACISVGHTDVDLRNLLSYHTIDPDSMAGGFESEVIEDGWNNGTTGRRYSATLAFVSQARLESTGGGAGSIFEGDYLTLTNGGAFDFSGAGSTVVIDHSIIRTQLGIKDSANAPRLQFSNPRDAEIKNSTIILDYIDPAGVGSVPVAYLYDGGSPGFNASLKLTNCALQLDPNLSVPAGVSRLIAAMNYGNDYDEVGTLTLDNCTFDADLDYVHTNYGGSIGYGCNVVVKNCVNIACKGIAYVQAANPTYHPDKHWVFTLDGNTILAAACAHYLTIVGNYAMTSSWHDQNSVCAAPTMITVPGMTALSNTAMTGGKMIHGTSSDPGGDHMHGFVDDQYTDGMDNWICTVLGCSAQSGAWDLAA